MIFDSDKVASFQYVGKVNSNNATGISKASSIVIQITIALRDSGKLLNNSMHIAQSTLRASDDLVVIFTLSRSGFLSVSHEENI